MKAGPSISTGAWGTTWQRQAVLTDPGSLAGDFFGSGLALHGPTLMVGSYGAGAVYVYARYSCLLRWPPSR